MNNDKSKTLIIKSYFVSRVNLNSNKIGTNNSESKNCLRYFTKSKA